MSHSPLVSVVTPAFNAARFIDETLASIRAQTHEDWELVVVDDGSTDDTRERVRVAASTDPRIRLLASPGNAGVAAARNLALEAVRGRYVAFLDGDDLWDPEKLEVQLAFMAEQAAPLAFTSYRLMSEGGAPLGCVRAVERTISYRDMLRGQRIGTLTAMLDRTLVPGFRFPVFQKASDLAGWLAILRDGRVAHGLERELATYRIVANSLSRSKLKHVGRVWEVYRAQDISPAERALCYAEYAVRGVLKHLRSGAFRVRPQP